MRTLQSVEISVTEISTDFMYTKSGQGQKLITMETEGFVGEEHPCVDQNSPLSQIPPCYLPVSVRKFRAPALQRLSCYIEGRQPIEYDRSRTLFASGEMKQRLIYLNYRYTN